MLINEITELVDARKARITFCTCELTRLIVLSHDHSKGFVFCKSNGDNS
jgi:hypothetical protein